jgi:integral membrane protein
VGLSFLEKLEAIKPFSEREAWGLFRLAAIGEAFGWTFLITGLLINRYKLIGYKLSVPIGGQLHGMLFVIYFAVLFSAYSSLRWPRTKFLLAVVAGVLPYGSLVFEQWATRDRRNHLCRSHFLSIAFHVASRQLAN